MEGSANAPARLPVEPATVTGGMPGPNALGGRLDDNVVCGIRISRPKSRLEGRAVMVAGFQYMAPRLSIGAATALPPIERLTGPGPTRIGPICAFAAGAPNETAAT